MVPDQIDSIPGETTRVLPIDKERTSRLRRFAASRQWFISRSPAKWEQALAILRRQLNGGEAAIDSVLDWYTTHYDKVPGLPKVQNGRELIRCWEWITGKMERQAPDVTVTAPALAIRDRLRRSGWKHSEPADLAVAVQLSINKLAGLKHNLGVPEIPGRMGPIRPGRPSPFSEIGIPTGFAAELYRQIGSVETFVEQWFERLAKWVRGKLVPRHVVSLDNPDFDKMVGGMAASCGSVSEWHKLRKILSREVPDAQHKRIDDRSR